jgi:hypothetical protein
MFYCIESEHKDHDVTSDQERTQRTFSPLLALLGAPYTLACRLKSDSWNSLSKNSTRGFSTVAKSISVDIDGGDFLQL